MHSANAQMQAIDTDSPPRALNPDASRAPATATCLSGQHPLTKNKNGQPARHASQAVRPMHGCACPITPYRPPRLLSRPPPPRQTGKNRSARYSRTTAANKPGPLPAHLHRHACQTRQAAERRDRARIFQVGICQRRHKRSQSGLRAHAGRRKSHDLAIVAPYSGRLRQAGHSLMRISPPLPDRNGSRLWHGLVLSPSK